MEKKQRRPLRLLQLAQQLKSEPTLTVATELSPRQLSRSGQAMDSLSNSHQGSSDGNNNGVRCGVGDRNVDCISTPSADAARGGSSSGGVSAARAPGMPLIIENLSLPLSSLTQTNRGHAGSRSGHSSLAASPPHANASSTHFVPETQPLQSNASVPGGITPELIWALASMRTGLQQQPQPNQQSSDGSRHHLATSITDWASLLAELFLASASRLGGGGAQIPPQQRLDASGILSLARIWTSALQGSNSISSEHCFKQGPQIRLEGLLEQIELLQQRQPPQHVHQESESMSRHGQGAAISQESASGGFPVGSSHPQQQYIGGSTAAEYVGMGLPPLAEPHRKDEKRHEDKKDHKKKRKKSRSPDDVASDIKPAADSKIGTVITTSGEADVGDADGNAQGGRPFLLPCRARGMPPEHNFRYAHFVIPPMVQHGEELICSYEACRDAGIKFRYCASCRIPVAKRNFNQRHSHGLPHVATVHSTWTSDINTPVLAAAVAATFGDVDPPPIVQKSIGVPSAPKPSTPDSSQSSSSDPLSSSRSSGEKDVGAGYKAANESPLANSDELARTDHSTPEGSSSETSSREKQRKRSQDGDSSRSRKREITVSVHVKESKLKKKSKRKKKKRNGKDRPLAPRASLLLEPNPDIPIERQLRWATLLGNRPELVDSDRMSAWLLEVMAVSDLTYPIRTVCTSSLTYSPSDFSNTDEEDEDDDEDGAGEVNKSGVSGSTETSSEAEEDDRDDTGKSTSSITSSPLGGLPAGSSAEDDAAAQTKENTPASRKRSLGNDEERLSGSFAEWKERKKKKAEAAAAHESRHVEEV